MGKHVFPHDVHAAAPGRPIPERLRDARYQRSLQRGPSSGFYGGHRPGAQGHDQFTAG